VEVQSANPLVCSGRGNHREALLGREQRKRQRLIGVALKAK